MEVSLPFLQDTFWGVCSLHSVSDFYNWANSSVLTKYPSKTCVSMNPLAYSRRPCYNATKPKYMPNSLPVHTPTQHQIWDCMFFKVGQWSFTLSKVPCTWMNLSKSTREALYSLECIKIRNMHVVIQSKNQSFINCRAGKDNVFFF